MLHSGYVCARFQQFCLMASETLPTQLLEREPLDHFITTGHVPSHPQVLDHGTSDVLDPVDGHSYLPAILQWNVGCEVQQSCMQFMSEVREVAAPKLPDTWRADRRRHATAMSLEPLPIPFGLPSARHLPGIVMFVGVPTYIRRAAHVVEACLALQCFFVLR